jgi:acyl carrier protein
MTADVPTLLDQVKRWLLEKHPERDDIGLDLDLIENRVIDSLEFLDLVFLLEEIAGRELHVEAQSAQSFRTLRCIGESILGGEAHAG